MVTFLMSKNKNPCVQASTNMFIAFIPWHLMTMDLNDFTVFQLQQYPRARIHKTS